MEFPELLRTWRAYYRISGRDAAEYFGIPADFLTRYETGSRTPHSLMEQGMRKLMSEYNGFIPSNKQFDYEGMKKELGIS